MTNDFLTQGLENDRYLKAVQLIERFESELRNELERAGREIVTANPELFIDDGDPNWIKKRSHSSVIAHQRVDYTMSLVNSTDEDASNLVLNLGFRWVEPGSFGRDGEGTLSIASYRIKNGPDDAYRDVMEATRTGEWGVSIGDDPFGSYPATFYVPVETAADIRESYDTLAAHFAEFAATFGVSK
jgi:hypothetical protein